MRSTPGAAVYDSRVKLSRPRLGDHAFPRRHRIDGVARVALHDSVAGAVYLIDATDWEIVSGADGTRDLPGIALTAARRGFPADPNEIGRLLDELAGFGVLVEGVGPATHVASEMRTPVTGALATRPVRGLPGYDFSCNGEGECCRRYSSIALTPADVIRAEHAGLRSFELAPSNGRLPPLRGGDGDDRVTLPLVDGACGELDADGRCGLHVRGGPHAKPVACTSYPRVLVDDGASIRVSVACECSCVFTSPQRIGQPLASGFETASDLPPGLTVRVLGAELAATPRAAGPRTDYLAWSDRTLSEFAPDDVPAWLLGTSAQLEAATVPFEEGPNPTERGSGMRARLAAELGRLRKVARAAAGAADAWRSAHDVTRLERRAIAECLERLDDEQALGSARSNHDLAGDERFFVRAGLFGHGFVGALPLSESLVRAAGAIVVTRLYGTTEFARRRSATHHPLATVLAALRGMQG